jgi:hypothetical protein
MYCIHFVTCQGYAMLFVFIICMQVMLTVAIVHASGFQVQRLFLSPSGCCACNTMVSQMMSLLCPLCDMYRRNFPMHKYCAIKISGGMSVKLWRLVTLKLHGLESSASYSGQFNPGESSPRNQERRPEGPQSQSGFIDEEKNLCPQRGSPYDSHLYSAS